MEFWSIGVLRYVRIAPRDCEVGDAEGAKEKSVIDGLLGLRPLLRQRFCHPFRAVIFCPYQGLKHLAKSYCPFGISATRPFWTMALDPN